MPLILGVSRTFEQLVARLDLGFECFGIPILNILAAISDFLYVIFIVVTVEASASIVTKSASGEAFAVHFKALRF